MHWQSLWKLIAILDYLAQESAEAQGLIQASPTHCILETEQARSSFVFLFQFSACKTSI